MELLLIPPFLKEDEPGISNRESSTRSDNQFGHTLIKLFNQAIPATWVVKFEHTQLSSRVIRVQKTLFYYGAHTLRAHVIAMRD